LRLALICAQVIDASGGKFKKRLLMVNNSAVISLYPNVVSGIMLGFKYSASSLGEYNGSKHH
jgi:hypothetical protein